MVSYQRLDIDGIICSSSLTGRVVNISLRMSLCICSLLFSSKRWIIGTAPWINAEYLKLQTWRSYGSFVNAIKVTGGISLGIAGSAERPRQFPLALCAMLLFLLRDEWWTTDSLLVSWIQQGLGAVLLDLWAEACFLFCFLASYMPSESQSGQKHGLLEHKEDIP